MSLILSLKLHLFKAFLGVYLFLCVCVFSWTHACGYVHMHVVKTAIGCLGARLTGCSELPDALGIELESSGRPANILNG